jgi:hypothetical protein
MCSVRPFFFCAALLFAIGPALAAEPFAIPTFHCLGLYWSPHGGAPDKSVLVRYRAQGEREWQGGLPMRYHPIEGTEEDLADYRGSIVHLASGTTYEVELSVPGTDVRAQLVAKTWSEEFPVAATERIASRNQPLAITQSGSPGAYRLYDGRGATIDVRHQHDTCITINASHVIVRGFTLKGAGAADRTTSTPANAISILGGEDIIIEDCDISDWGRMNPKTGFGFNMESAIASRSPTLRRLVVQRCRIHESYSRLKIMQSTKVLSL